MNLRAREELRAFALAVMFLTRLPMPNQDPCGPEHLAASVRYYPLVGVLLGVLCAGAFWLAHLFLSGVVAVLIALATGLVITGALHEDGLADSFDSIGAVSGGEDQRKRMLKIMRDSRIGTFGAAALFMALALKAAVLASLAPTAVCVALIAGHGLSRVSSIVLMRTSVYIRDNGVATPVADGPGLPIWSVSLAIAAVPLAGIFLSLGAATAAWAVSGAAAGHVLTRFAFERKLGGYTGDTLGAVQQASEIGIYLGISAGLAI